MTRILAGAFLACLLACQTAVAQAPQAGGAPARNSIMLARVIMAFPAGTVWVDLKRSAAFCDEPGLTRTSAGGREPQELPPYAAAFKTELEHAGYRVVTPGEDNLFDPESAAADFQAAAVVTDGHIKGCISKGGFGTNAGDVKGESILKIDWQIYSPIRKQVVAHVSTSGSAKLENSTPGGAQRLMMEAFSGNARELASSADFRAAVSGVGPRTNDVLLPGKQDKIALAGSQKASKRPISDAVGSVVTILTGSGSGTGDLVSADGYMLTNAHVVGDEKQVRVRWSDGIESVAEVVRVAKDRDIALIKTNPRDREPLAIKRGAVTPGQRVYAIGSPRGKDFQGTVSSGVVSASRIFDGLRFIQSDVSVSPGSSGGVLLDEAGSVIGITDLGVDNGGRAGLNLFIPIGDAMDFLNLEQN